MVTFNGYVKLPNGSSKNVTGVPEQVWYVLMTVLYFVYRSRSPSHPSQPGQVTLVFLPPQNGSMRFSGFP